MLTNSGKNLAMRDREVIWHPYTQMKDMIPVVPVTSAKGVYLFDEGGNKYLDAVSSWWVNIHGHANSYIAEQVFKQLNTLEHVIFAGFTHEPAVVLAERLLKILPQNQKKVFYSDNGSTAVEVAIKMCLQYWKNNNSPRKKILAFKNAYHGDTFGAMSVSGRSLFTDPFTEFLFDVEFIDLPSEDNISLLIEKIDSVGKDLACFIFEPLIQGSAGMIMYNAGHLDILLKACRRHHILAIADEVMTGFGRTGTIFACEQVSVLPDIVCLSKGLTGGTMAMGITTCSNEIYNAFLSEDKIKTLYHGHSYTANPLACTAANASLDLLLTGKTKRNLRRIEAKHRAFLKTVEGHRRVESVRQTGTILAIEWKVKGGTSYLSSLRDDLYNFFMGKGILLRPLGNVIYILPPYVITNSELARIYKAILEALEIF